MLSLQQIQVTSADPRDTVAAASNVTPRLLSDLTTQSGMRMPPPSSPQGERLLRLIAAEAWTDVALALIETGLPEWRLVRLVFDEGEWCCALSRHWEMPDWLDDAVEARHEVLPLAILLAFAEARAVSAPARLRSVSMPRPAQGEFLDPVCCDNFC